MDSPITSDLNSGVNINKSRSNDSSSHFSCPDSMNSPTSVTTDFGMAVPETPPSASSSSSSSSSSSPTTATLLSTSSSSSLSGSEDERIANESKDGEVYGDHDDEEEEQQRISSRNYGMHPRISIRESLRARLRAQEARLIDLVQNANARITDSPISSLSPTACLSSVLKKTPTSSKKEMHSVEQENSEEKVAAPAAVDQSELEYSLDRFKLAMEGADNNFLKEKMAGIQKVFELQVKTIQNLQQQCTTKSEEVENLQLELVEKLERIIELEFDLETHDIHFTNYAAEQFQLGEDALNEIKLTKTQGLNDSSTTDSSEANGKNMPRKAQKLISKLLFDLDTLETRFKEERLKSIQSIKKLSVENEELKTQIEILRKHTEKKNDNASAIDTSSDGEDHFQQISITRMNKIAEMAKARQALLRNEVQTLQNELTQTKTEAAYDRQRAKQVLDTLKQQNQLLEIRIANAEAKKKEKRSTGGLFKKKKPCEQSVSHTNSILMDLEAKIQERCQLEDSMEIKDKQIRTLKKEMTKLRLRQISEGKLQDTNCTQFDVHLLRSVHDHYVHTCSHTSASPAECDQFSSNAYIAELKQQLQEVQTQLVMMGQEVANERANAASTAAEFLSRIAELHGKIGAHSTPL